MAVYTLGEDGLPKEPVAPAAQRNARHHLEEERPQPVTTVRLGDDQILQVEAASREGPQGFLQDRHADHTAVVGASNDILAKAPAEGCLGGRQVDLHLVPFAADDSKQASQRPALLITKVPHLSRSLRHKRRL